MSVEIGLFLFGVAVGWFFHWALTPPCPRSKQ